LILYYTHTHTRTLSKVPALGP